MGVVLGSPVQLSLPLGEGLLTVVETELPKPGDFFVDTKVDHVFEGVDSIFLRPNTNYENWIGCANVDLRSRVPEVSVEVIEEMRGLGIGIYVTALGIAYVQGEGFVGVRLRVSRENDTYTEFESRVASATNMLSKIGFLAGVDYKEGIDKSCCNREPRVEQAYVFELYGEKSLIKARKYILDVSRTNDFS